MSEDEKPEDATEAETETSEGETAGQDDGEASKADGDEGEDTDEGGEEAPSGLKGKLAGKLKFIIIGAVALVIVGGGATAYFLGAFTKEKLHETTVMLPGPPVYHELQKITVDLKPSEKRARPFIRLGMQVELQGETAKAAFIENEVRIMDAFQSHLRTVTAEELSGEEGTQRLREDFTIIINRIIDPERAITVLYKDILVR